MENISNKYLTQKDYQNLFESAPGLYLVLKPDFTIVGVSDNYAKATMTIRENILGRKLFDVFPDNPGDANADGVSNLKRSLLIVLESKAPHTMPIQKYDIRRPDGTFEERYWSPKNTPVFAEDQNIAFIIHRVEDVTEFVHLKRELEANNQLSTDLKKQASDLEIELYKSIQEVRKLNKDLELKVLERSSQLKTVNKVVSDYQFALDQSAIVALTDQNGIIKEVNDNFCKLSKYSREELIGKDHRIINSGYHPKEFISNLWQTIANGKIWKGEIKNRAKDGTFYWVETTIVPFLDSSGKPYQYLDIRSDITQRKAVEEEIRKFNEELEDKVRKRTMELNQSLEREKDLSDMKSRFVSIASHEFRTPLSAILSSAALLRRYTGPENEEKREKHFSRIEQSVKNLTEILEDFLSLEKIEQGTTEIKPVTFNLPDYLIRIVTELEGMLKMGQSISVQHRGGVNVTMDEKILRSVLVNLLSNAIKYSPADKTILLRAEVESDKIKILVIDQGIGIPEEDQKNMFNTFFRAKNAELIQGTGLGLTIVKRYMELLHGSVSFKSIQDQGTTFSLEFPIQA